MGRIITVTAWPGQTNPEVTVNGFGFQIPIGQQITVTDAVYQAILNIQIVNGITLTDGGSTTDPAQSAEISADLPMP